MEDLAREKEYERNRTNEERLHRTCERFKLIGYKRKVLNRAFVNDENKNIWKLSEVTDFNVDNMSILTQYKETR
jgi:hypothetical protein